MNSVVSPSWWHLTAERRLQPSPMDGDKAADIAIIGAGLTGLWTAYYLKQMQPNLRICLLEKEIAGAGASGRNGGWCSGDMAASHKEHENKKPGSAYPMARAIQATVDEVGRVANSLNIDCDFQKGGIIRPALNSGQLNNLTEVVSSAQSIGLTDDDIRLLDADEVSEHIRIPGVIGGTYTPHCAAIHPYKLAAGLADALIDMGCHLFEQTSVTGFNYGKVFTDKGCVTADVTMLATEAYTPLLAGQKRKILPVENYMIVTERIAKERWDDIGLHKRQVFEDGRNLIYYGQRTADDRIAIGGLSAPYNFGSKITPKSWGNHQSHDLLRAILTELFPCLEGTSIEHKWGGILGVPRDMYPSVGYDKNTQLAWAGGYVGQGVAATNFAARTVADLILEKNTELTELPWVNHRSPDWEPEPLRWLGTRLAGSMMTLSDWADHNDRKLIGSVSQSVRKTLGL